ncbi:MAG TPA: DUF2723 domain-containing protein [Thermoanaerobaculia bacterium]|nr:DUF2723 domain-containing protein [Thermoanaerobaculia bacterium]
MSAWTQEAAPHRRVAAAAPAALRQRLMALAAAVAAVVTRVPFAAQRLWDHDSVQFALGVERYDLAAHHPHPPGYPLYIAILKLLAAAGIDALHGMVALSIAAAALGAALIVPLTARLASAVAAARAGAAAASEPTAGGPGPGAGPPESAGPLAAGALAAALYVCNPLLWFYGELPLVYAVEGGLTVGLAYAALRMADGPGPLLAACAAFALAGGVRPSTLVLLLPLFLLGAWRAWRRGTTIGTLAAGAAVAAVFGLAWLLPLLAAAGGLAAYRRIGSENFGALLPYTSILYGAGWQALAHNLTIMTKWFLQGLLPAAVALGALWLWPARSRGALTPVVDGVRLLAASWQWLVAWAVPPMLFFALFHVTKAGYTLVYLPALLVAASLLAAPAMCRGWRRDHQSSGEVAAGGYDDAGAAGWSASPAASGAVDGMKVGAALVLAAATGAGFFLFGADRRPDQPRALAVVRNEFNRGAIAAYERDLDRLLATLRRLPPATTVLATVELSGTGPAGADGFLYPWQRHLQWYLPGYEVLHLVPEERFALVTRGHVPFHREGPAIELPPGTRQLAIVLSGPTGERFPLAAWPPQLIGKTFDLVVVPVAEHLELGPFRFTIHRRQAA